MTKKLSLLPNGFARPWGNILYQNFSFLSDQNQSYRWLQS